MQTTNERITLRLERQNLERMDRFLRENVDLSNRSQLARVALQEFLDRMERETNTVTVRVPKQFLDYIDKKVEEGYYASREFAIQQCIEQYFSKERISEIEDLTEALLVGAGKKVRIFSKSIDEVIER